MADVLNLANQYSSPVLPTEPSAGRRGWKVVFEVVAVLILASVLVVWFAMVRNQTSSGSLFPSKEQLIQMMMERPAVSLTDVQKQQLFSQMVKPVAVKGSAAPKAPKTLTKAQRASLFQKMVAGQ